MQFKTQKINPTKRLIRYFMQGLLYMAPISITVYAIVISFQFLDGLVSKYIEGYLGYNIPGLGLLTVLVSITVIGFLGSSLIFNPIMRYLDRLVGKAPLIKIIYSAMKDLFQAFVGQQKKFTEPVLVKLNKEHEFERLGFVTQHDLTPLGIEENKVAVYFPASYSIMGELYIVPRENITPIDTSPADVMKLIISGGVTRIS
ncbi:MAG: DUF502 domain-containing protein [Bacteroidales bacterium]|nr:DUF502 domain-containing protein [Bacteroidales bacterium]